MVLLDRRLPALISALLWLGALPVAAAEAPKKVPATPPAAKKAKAVAAPAEPAPTTFQTFDATTPDAPPPAPQVIIASPPPPSNGEAADVVAKPLEPAPTDTKRFRIAPRVGILIPRTELRVGPVVGADFGVVVPIDAMKNRLKVQLGGGYASTRHKGPKLVPGRGLDDAFIQNTSLIPLELLATFDVLTAPLTLTFGAGYGFYITRTEFQDLGSTQQQNAVASALVLNGRAMLPAGPGGFFLDIRHAELKANLGTLGSVATSTFSGTSFALGYGFEL